jgi:hypothetical protein
MKSIFPVLAASALVFCASTAEAARPMSHFDSMSHGNSVIVPAQPLGTVSPPTVNPGALDLPTQSLGSPPVNPGAIGVTNPGAIGMPNAQSFAGCARVTHL